MVMCKMCKVRTASRTMKFDKGESSELCSVCYARAEDLINEPQEDFEDAEDVKENLDDGDIEDENRTNS